jgi:hypothetical protein
MKGKTNETIMADRIDDDRGDRGAGLDLGGGGE